MTALYVNFSRYGKECKGKTERLVTLLKQTGVPGMIHDTTLQIN